MTAITLRNADGWFYTHARKVAQDLAKHAELTAHYQSMGETRESASRMAFAQMKGLPVRFACEMDALKQAVAA